jgi:anti-anti-sigma factor
MPVTRQLFSVSVAPDGAIVPTGTLDLSTIQELRDLVDEAMAPGRAIVLDLAQLTFMDSSVIHWLVEICDATGHPVVLRNASPVVRRILDIATTMDFDGDAWVFDGDRASPSTVREKYPRSE